MALLFNILYVIFATREQIICWVFGLIGVSLLLAIYVEARLYSDATLQVFYIVMSIYGWASWSKRRKQPTLSISILPIRRHAWLLVLGVIMTVLLGKFWTLFDAALPFADAFTSSFSIIATFMVARKILENWIYWIVIDTVCVVIYVERELWVIALLFVIYTIIAIFGWKVWYEKWKHDRNPDPSI
ncbi:MAG: nicotinamide riboside transporter PnuC [Saprospiraceae bacterium]|nr:nicotinamide riboside transporter PnuC [Saprospiraceae bacterium]